MLQSAGGCRQASHSPAHNCSAVWQAPQTKAHLYLLSQVVEARLHKSVQHRGKLELECVLGAGARRPGRDGLAATQGEASNTTLPPAHLDYFILLSQYNLHSIARLFVSQPSIG